MFVGQEAFIQPAQPQTEVRHALRITEDRPPRRKPTSWPQSLRQLGQSDIQAHPVQRRRRHSQIEAALAQVRGLDVAMNDLQAWSIDVSEENESRRDACWSFMPQTKRGAGVSAGAGQVGCLRGRSLSRCVRALDHAGP
jgi:hypothetical protein